MRDAALRRLSREAARALRQAAHSPDSFPERLWRCAAEAVERAVGDKVLKVHLSAVRCVTFNSLSILQFYRLRKPSNYMLFFSPARKLMRPCLSLLAQNDTC